MLIGVRGVYGDRVYADGSEGDMGPGPGPGAWALALALARSRLGSRIAL